MSRPWTELLQTVEPTDARTAGGLQVFGLRWQPDEPLTYATLDEALATQTLTVTEITEGGSVPTLKVSNKRDTLVFLMAGEQLVGAKQNRVLNTSLLVPAQSELPIPVSCVEAGRWAYRGKHFGSPGTASHSKLRKLMSKHVTDNYRKGAGAYSDQGEVWKTVSDTLSCMGSVSPSYALQQVYEDRRASLDDILTQLPAPEGCSGAAFAFGGRLVGIDLFDQPATLAKLWPKLVRAYALDSLMETETHAEPLTPEAVRQWLRTAATAKAQTFPSPGLGEDWRLESKGVLGAGLVVKDHPVHVEMFAEA
jgi:hypothetical protein